MKSKYASAERLSQSEINNQYKDISNAEFVNNIFNSLPHIAAVLNSDRQIIFSNNILIKKLGISSIKDVLGSRPGELISCVNSKKEEGGCGTSEQCKYCGAVNAFLKSQNENVKVESECTILSEIEGQSVTFEFGIVVNPFSFEDKSYYILSLFDISDSKRRLFLEKIFFHDIINKAGSLNGFLQLIKTITDPAKKDEYIETLDKISEQLINEIFSQKQLLEAENGTLTINKELVESIQYLNTLIQQISQHEVSKGIRVELNEFSESFSFFTDSSLLGRIILNMLKNAVEATKSGEVVNAGCNITNKKILFYVNNPSYMTKEIQSKIFNRSFSTKGSGRGLGTYSMKVLAEKYLKSEIYFETSEEKGTTFYLKLNSKSIN